MSSSQKMITVDGKQRYKCHRATLKTAKKGKLLDPEKEYGRYAYFCGAARMKGWSKNPCNCTEHTTLR